MCHSILATDQAPCLPSHHVDPWQALQPDPWYHFSVYAIKSPKAIKKKQALCFSFGAEICWPGEDFFSNGTRSEPQAAGQRGLNSACSASLCPPTLLWVERDLFLSFPRATSSFCIREPSRVPVSWAEIKHLTYREHKENGLSALWEMCYREMRRHCLAFFSFFLQCIPTS